MAERTIMVCDVCGREGAGTWQIVSPRGTGRELDLCAEHGADLQAMARRGRKPGKPPGLTRHKDLRIGPERP